LLREDHEVRLRETAAIPVPAEGILQIEPPPLLLRVGGEPRPELFGLSHLLREMRRVVVPERRRPPQTEQRTGETRAGQRARAEPLEPRRRERVDGRLREQQTRRVDEAPAHRAEEREGLESIDEQATEDDRGDVERRGAQSIFGVTASNERNYPEQ